MSSMFKVKWDNEALRIIIWKLDEPAHCYDIETEEVEDKPWFQEVQRYLEAQEYPEGVLYPKIYPPIYLKTFQERTSNCSRKSKG